MSAEDMIKKLEIAAQDALGSNAASSAQRRNEAEGILLSFRRSNPNFHLCKMILENSTLDTVQYQAAAALKDAIIREWSGIDEEAQNSLQQFILNFVINNETLSHFLRGILVQILAIMIKFTVLGSKEREHRQSLYTCLTSLITSGDHMKQILACSILSALCIEFSITSKSSNVGIPWEQHGKAKRQFEEFDLKVIFDLIFNVLRHIDKFEVDHAMFHTQNSLCEKFLSIAEQVLTWSFSPPIFTRRNMLSQAEDQKVLFKPHADWKSVLLDTSNLHLFFNIHKKCRQNQNLCQLSVSCLSQLASLQGPVLTNKEEECYYVNHFIQETLTIYNSVELFEHEAMGVANICKNIVEAHKLEIWAGSLEMQQLFHQFLCCLTKLTCTIILGAAKQEPYTEDLLYMESFEILLDTWTTISESINGPKSFIVPCAMQIVEAYILSHICHPEGNRAIVDDGDVDIDELEEDDRERFCGQLMSIACLGRTSPVVTLEMLSNFLEKRTDMLLDQVHKIQQKAVTLDATLMQNLFEDLHWLVLISGHVLADDTEGETALMPSEIVQCSISVKNQIDKNMSLCVLGSPHQAISSLTSAKQQVDPVIRAVSAVLRLCEITSTALRLQLFQCLSPQLTQDIMWFLQVWSQSYLFFNEEYYKEISPTMSAAFGPDSEGGRWTVDYLVKTACTVVTSCTFESKLLEDTTDMLIALVQSDKRCAVVASCSEFWELGRDFCNGNPLFDKLSPIVRHHLMSSLVMAGTSNMNMYREVFWDHTLNLIKARYENLISSQAFKKNAQDCNVRNSVISVFDLLQGIAEAATAENSSMIFNFLSPFLETGSNVMHAYQDDQVIIVSVLELFVEVSHKQVCYLNESKCRHLYEWIFSVLKAYSTLAINHQHAKGSEEDSFQDLSLIIELLTHLLTKDFIDFSESDTEIHAEVIIHPQADEISVADVVFYGLGIILPHINVELLAYPTLCCQYFKLVTFLCEIYPEKVENLGSDILNAFLYSLQLGLHSYGVDNTKLCLEAILALTDQCYGKEETSSPLHSALLPFVKLVFDVILMHAADMDLMRTAGETFYSMFCFSKKTIMDLLSNVVANQQDATYRDRLIQEFNKLSYAHEESLNPDRRDKTKFIKLLEEIIFNVRGILCVK